MFDPVLFAALMGSTALFSPSSLFSAGEQGAWYDPSDFDRYIAPVGSELVTNGDFSNGTTGWTTAAANSISVVSGQLKAEVTSGVDAAYFGQSVSVVSGKWYEVKFATISDGTSKIARLFVGGFWSGTAITPNAFGSYTVKWQATSTGSVVFWPYGTVGGTGTYILCDNISVKELTAIDTATMFTDAAGTTPVTAVEQPVGLLLDKSKGLALGAELVTNGDFASDSDWTKGTGWTIGSGVASSDGSQASSSNLSQSAGLVNGKTYKVTFTVSNRSAGAFRPVVGGGGAGSFVSANGTFTQYVVCVAGPVLYLQADADFVGSIDNISVRELPGNHASQSTSASRPVLSARVNLLTYSEQFDNAAWLKFSVAVPVTKYADPYGGTTANLLYPTAATTDASLYRGGFATVGKTHSYAVKAAGKSWFCILKEGTSGGAAWFNLSTGLVGTVAAGYAASNPVSLGNGWYRCTVTSTSGFSQYTAISAVDADNSTTPTPNGTDGVYIWGADLRVTNDGVGIPAYQRVAAATDYDTSGFPLYLKFDGIDDSLATGTIDFSATDKMSVFAGVRKLSDAAEGFIVELSDTLNAGTFRTYAPRGGATNFSWRTGGSSFSEAAATYVAPISAVVTGVGNISADVSTLRVNGVQAATNAADQGTGNFGNYPIYIGRRNNATSPLNGNLYSLIVRGALSTDAQIASTETYVNNLTKAY